jgi:ribosome-associated protein
MQSQEFRTQGENKTKVIEKFAEVLLETLLEPEERIETSPTKASKEKRIDSKKKEG